MLSNLRVSANKLAKEFEIITGISCCVVDIDDAEKNKAFNDAGFCAICNRIRKEKLGEIDCRNMMSYSCMQSEQWGGKYESLCPISLAFISTVVYNDKEKFGLCMGPFLMMELDDFISEDIVSAFPPEVRGEIVEEVKKILSIYKERIILPKDCVVESIEKINQKNVNEIDPEDIIYDIGSKTIESFKEVINNAKTIFLNGTAGKYELENFETGTKAVLELVSKSNAYTVIGGGDALSSSEYFNIDGFSFKSTGGGATLDYIANGKLKCLEDENTNN